MTAENVNSMVIGDVNYLKFNMREIHEKNDLLVDTDVAVSSVIDER